MPAIAYEPNLCETCCRLRPVVHSREEVERPDEDPADGIPDAGVALRGTGLRYSLGFHRESLRAHRRHRRRCWLCSRRDALEGLRAWVRSSLDSRCGCCYPCSSSLL